MIEVEHLTKYYGSFLAVDDISFTIEDGHVYGFLGPNGAGKSTTMNIITGCLSATAGRVRIDGHDIYEEPDKAKRLIGYLPEHPPLYLNESPREYLRFVGEAKGLRGKELQRQIAEVVEKTGIAAVQTTVSSQISSSSPMWTGMPRAASRLVSGLSARSLPRTRTPRSDRRQASALMLTPPIPIIYTPPDRPKSLGNISHPMPCFRACVFFFDFFSKNFSKYIVFFPKV